MNQQQRFGILGIWLVGLFALSGCADGPGNNYNDMASLSTADQLDENPLLEHVITSTIDPGKRTMGTLYGNTVAWEYGTTHRDFHYPQGTVLYEVTWRQQPDAVWFGANIPKEIIRIERVGFEDPQEPSYTLYEGHPLRERSTNGAHLMERIGEIVSQRFAMAP